MSGESPSQTELVTAVERVETLLRALLTIQVDQYLRATEIAKPRMRTIDRMLSDAGFSQPEVAKILGKSQQAVSNVLRKEARPVRSGTSAVEATS
jgi:predicted XRE-type DNA-binding protein